MAVLGQDSGSYTPQDVERKRRWAEILLKGGQTAKEPFGALAQGLRGALAGYSDYEADQAEAGGRKTVAELLSGKDYMGALNSEWASPQQAALASMLQGRDWQMSDRSAQWAREDQRAAQARAEAAAAASAPKWSMFESNGDQYRYNANDPNSRPELFFDGPDAPGFRPLTAEEKVAAGLPPDMPAQVGPDGKIDTIGGGGVKVDVNNMGNIPAGYTVQYDENRNPISMAPVPGSPAAAEAEAAAAKAAAAADNKAQGAGIVVEDVNRAVDLINKDPALTTGFVGNILKNVGGLSANNVSSLIDTIKANSAFDQLQAMRAASPTGGALGAVSDTENRLLQSAIGSLEQSQTADQLVYNLKRVQKIYGDIVNGPNAGGGGTDYKSKYGLE